MTLRGEIKHNSLKIIGLELEKILTIYFDIIEDIKFEKLESHNFTLEPSYLNEFGIPISKENNTVLFKMREDMVKFLTTDIIFLAKGKISFKNSFAYDFEFENQELILNGDNIAFIKDLLLKNIPMTEGQFIIKKGLFFERILLENKEKMKFLLINPKKKLREIENYLFFYSHEFIIVLVFILSIFLSVIEFYKKPIFLLLTLTIIILFPFFHIKITKMRFLKELCKSQKTIHN